MSETQAEADAADPESVPRTIASGPESQVQPDLLRLVMEGADDPILILDSTGRALQANDAARKRFGWESPEAAARLPFAAVLMRWRLETSEGRPIWPEALPFARALAGQGPCEGILRAIHRETGTGLWWQMRAVPEPDKDGKAPLVVVQIRDMTRLRALEDSLKQERQAVRTIRNLMQSVMDALPDCLAVFDSQGRILYANKGMSDFLGSDTLERGFTDPLHRLPGHLEFSDENGDAVAWAQLPLQAALHGEFGADRVVRYRDHRKGKQGWTCMRAAPILDLGGRLVMVTALFQDLPRYSGPGHHLGA